MLSSTERPAAVNLFRPSLLAWRAKYKAEKTAQVAKPEPAPKPAPASAR